MNLEELFGLDPGTRVPGGCEDCDATTLFRVDELGGRLTVEHDDACPRWAAIRRDGDLGSHS